MGNDGGSIPKRRELVKEAARTPNNTELKATQQEQQEFYWNTDPLSNRPLARPVVSDCSGNLYNKDSILEYLLPSEDGSSKSSEEEILHGAVKSSRDVVEVKFEVDDDAGSTESTGKKAERWICPITNKTLGPGSKAVYLVPCGHAFSASAVKEVSGEKCLQCNEPYASNDIIPILPTAVTDIARLSLRMKILAEKGLTHSLKKVLGTGKKRKKGVEADVDGADAVDQHRKVTDGSKQKPIAATPQPTSGTATPSGIKNAATASLTAKVLEEQENAKRRKMAENDNFKSLFSPREQKKLSTTSKDFMSRGYSTKS